MLISPEYLKVQQEAHKDTGYGLSGHKWAGFLLKFGTKDILDYGCGKRTLQKRLGFPIQNYDPAIPEFSGRPSPAELVYCGDVMEHVEPEFVDDVLDDIRGLTKGMAVFVIHTTPAKRILPNGENAHLVVMPANWWVGRVKKYFKVIETSKNELEVMIVGEPKSV